MSKGLTLLEAVEQLDEGLLTSDFTMGFELECYISEDSPIYDEVTDNRYYNYDSDDSDDENRYVMDNISDFITRKLKTIDNVSIPDETMGHSGAHEDSSVNDRNDYRDISVEYSSPIIPCKPIWFNRIIKTLKYLMNNGVYVNNTCGFHHHLHFKGMDERDMVWLYCNIATDPEIHRDFSSLNGWYLDDDTYASYDKLNDLGNAIIDRNFDEVLSLLNTHKWRVFRIHPQGTLEWRGPRGFLEEGTNSIKDFYKLFIKLIGKITTYMDSKVVVGSTVTKDELFNGLTNAVENAELTPTLEFLRHDESYDSNKKMNYISKIGKVSEESMKKFANAIAKNPMIIYTLIMDDNNKVGKFIDSMMVSYSGETSFKKALKKLNTMNKVTPEFIAHFFKVTDINEMDRYIKLLLECGYHEYINKDVIARFLEDSDAISTLYFRLETIIENQIPISIKTIEKALLKEAQMDGFNYDDFVRWFISTNRLQLSPQVITKILMFMTQSVVIKGFDYTLPRNNESLKKISNIVTSANMVNDWNNMVKQLVRKDCDMYKLFVGEKTLKDIFMMVKMNPMVKSRLSDKDIETLENNDIYI